MGGKGKKDLRMRRGEAKYPREGGRVTSQEIQGKGGRIGRRDRSRVDGRRLITEKREEEDNSPLPPDCRLINSMRVMD